MREILKISHLKNSLVYLTLIFLFISQTKIMSQNIIYDFYNQSDISEWTIVNDDVMGGLSSCKLSIDKEGNGVFEGKISIANNGGFSSTLLNFDKVVVKKGAYLLIRVKGDNKKYQLRIKANRSDYYSYVYSFKTSSEWETISIPLTSMYPSFRGRKLPMNNFDNTSFEQIAFLIGNKKNENFKLKIDSILLID